MTQSWQNSFETLAQVAVTAWFAIAAAWRCVLRNLAGSFHALGRPVEAVSTVVHGGSRS
jgi:hypothetical protein